VELLSLCKILDNEGTVFNWILLWQTHTYAYQYCCSLGMQLYRPTNYTQLQSVTYTLSRTDVKNLFGKIYWQWKNFSVTYGSATAVIGFSKEYNTTHELWCDTNTLVDKSAILPNGLYPGYTCQSSLLMAHLYLPSTSYVRVRDLPYTFNTFLCQ
jgi:hypothetical protein